MSSQNLLHYTSTHRPCLLFWNNSGQICPVAYVVVLEMPKDSRAVLQTLPFFSLNPLRGTIHSLSSRVLVALLQTCSRASTYFLKYAALNRTLCSSAGLTNAEPKGTTAFLEPFVAEAAEDFNSQVPYIRGAQKLWHALEIFWLL